MKRLLIALAILAVFALGFTVGASTAIRTAEYWSDGEGVYVSQFMNTVGRRKTENDRENQIHRGYHRAGGVLQV